MNPNFTNQMRNSWPPGLLRPPTPRFSASGLCQARDSILSQTLYSFVQDWQLRLEQDPGSNRRMMVPLRGLVPVLMVEIRRVRMRVGLRLVDVRM